MADADKQVYLLGAGFSKAASPYMPLMSQLAVMVVAELDGGYDELKVFNDDLEAWLSFLASAQPWLSEAENLRNRALSLEVSAAIFKVIEHREQQALQDVMPVWLQRLVWHMSDQSAEILTFNYDLLLERACRQLRRAHGFSDLYVAPLTQRSRPNTGISISASKTPEPHVRLHKLHGSTNWYGGGAGLSVVRDVGNWSADGVLLDPPELYADLRPMVIPPVAVKDVFYGDQALRAGWIRAAQALERAETLTIIGYSLPLTDTSTTALLGKRLHPDAQVTVVDRSGGTAERVCDRLRAWDVEVYSGDEALARYVDDTCPHHVEWGVDDDVEVPHVVVDGIPVPQAELAVPAKLPDPGDWPPNLRFARWVGQHWPGSTAAGAAIGGLPSDRWPHPGGVGFSPR